MTDNTVSVSVLAVLIASTATISAAVRVRDRVPFDYAWRFALTYNTTETQNHNAVSMLIPVKDNECLKPFNSTPHGTCSGLKATVQGNSSVAACKAVCCANPECYVYQYQLAGANPSGVMCWTGRCVTPLQGNNPDWISGAIEAPPLPPSPPTPPPSQTPPPTPVGYCPDCTKDFDDSKWQLVDVPHDYIVALPIVNSKIHASGGYFPRKDAVYRKHFVLPTDWQGSRISLLFEGVYKVATVYVNGEFVLTYGGVPGSGGPSARAYTEFEVRLDNLTNIGFGTSDPNVIAVSVDGSYGTEHWYAGAGIYRSVHLIRSNIVHIDATSIFFPYTTGLPDKTNAAVANIAPHVGVVNDGESVAHVVLGVDVLGTSDKTSQSQHVVTATVPAKSTLQLALPNITMKAELWSIQTPVQYLAVTTLSINLNGVISKVDQLNTSIGLRSTSWDIDTGFFLNGDNIKLRGFCHHDDFTGVGMAMPDRIWLLRLMQTRTLGGNSMRTSHNNYRDGVYDIADAVGVVVWDENRDLREPGLEAVQKMVKSHRNHPSIVIYSLCNEGECHPAGPTNPHGNASNRWPHNATLNNEFRSEIKALDSTRPVSANMWDEYGPGSLTDVLDVQGISHPNLQIIEGIRALEIQKPLICSECCSCQTQRGENYGTVPPTGHPPGGVGNLSNHFGAFNGDCLQSYVNMTDSLPYVAGSMIWTLADYLGEPAPIYWPDVSGSFGSIDLAGFPKGSAHWFQTWWLNAPGPKSPAGRPPLPNGTSVYIVETNEPPPKNRSQIVTYHVYSSAHSVELFSNGRSLGTKQNNDWMGWMEWNATFSAGNLTDVAKNTNGAPIAVHTRLTSGAPSKIVLSIDSPNPATATGSRVVLDGHDVALVRATIVDNSGNMVPSEAFNITFKIGGGPGRILGVGNGDPFCHEPHQVPWRTSYNGLARAVVKVTEDAASIADIRDLIRSIDVDSGKSFITVVPGAGTFSPTPITVQASAQGLVSGSINIDTSNSLETDGVLAVAGRSLHLPVTLE